MKENSNPDVCPCCGQNISKLEKIKYLFIEQWCDALRKEAHIHKIEFGSFEEACILGNALSPSGLNSNLLTWEIKNPRPEINHIDFTVQLAQRVEHLESLLREKGGQ